MLLRQTTPTPTPFSLGTSFLVLKLIGFLAMLSDLSIMELKYGILALCSFYIHSLGGEGLNLDFYWKYRVINANFGEDL